MTYFGPFGGCFKQLFNIFFTGIVNKSIKKLNAFMNDGIYLKKVQCSGGPGCENCYYWLECDYI